MYVRARAEGEAFMNNCQSLRSHLEQRLASSSPAIEEQQSTSQLPQQHAGKGPTRCWPAKCKKHHPFKNKQDVLLRCKQNISHVLEMMERSVLWPRKMSHSLLQHKTMKLPQAAGQVYVCSGHDEHQRPMYTQD